MNAKGFCVCERDDDGKCTLCQQNLSGVISEFSLIFKDYLEKVDELKGKLGGTCNECSIEYADAVIANLAILTKDGPERIVRACFGAYIDVMHNQGVFTHPCTDKVWRDICQARGWAS